MIAAAPTVAEDIRELRGPITVAVGHSPLIWLGVAVALVAVAIAVWAFLRRRRAPVTPEAAALEALEAARPLIAAGEALAFSTRVSDAMRGYHEVAFGVRAPRKTTEELLSSLLTDASPVSAQRTELGAFLAYCDLAKYARQALSQTQMNGMLTSAETFVRATAGATP